MRLLKNTRFSLRNEGDLYWIQDRQDPSAKPFSTMRQVDEHGRVVVDHDYGLVSRVLNPMTGRVDVTVGGLTGYGTTAAGEFATNENYLQGILKQAPAGWERKNVQIVLRTDVVKGASGPPQVVKTWFW
jgi:hypothetical protein